MSTSIILASKLDLATVSGLMETLGARHETNVVLDMSEVKHLGTLCVQVILSAAKTATSENRTLTITNVSDRVTDQLRVMGMTPDALTRGCQ